MNIQNPIGYVARHGQTRAFQHNQSTATLLWREPLVFEQRINMYRDGFELDGVASAIMSSPSDRCIQTALLMAQALVPGFDATDRIEKLEEVVREAMSREPNHAYHNWFHRAVVARQADGAEVLGGFPEGAVLQEVQVVTGLSEALLVRRSMFPEDRIWAISTHADVVAALRRREVRSIHCWNMHPISCFPDSIAP